jgi:hypothetical protein
MQVLPARLQSAWDSLGRAVWKPRFHVLTMPGLSGYGFSLATTDRHSACVREADLTPLPDTATILGEQMAPSSCGAWNQAHASRLSPDTKALSGASPSQSMPG